MLLDGLTVRYRLLAVPVLAILTIVVLSAAVQKSPSAPDAAVAARDGSEERLRPSYASVYEQCGEVDGRIHGFTNWRLAGLQEAIRDGRVPSFKTLCSTTDHQFYHEDPGTNYGQARYLCYYLQQHGLLRKFYHRFHANRAKDPTGYNTLKEILGRDRMDAFKKDWEAYVLKLRFSS